MTGTAAAPVATRTGLIGLGLLGATGVLARLAPSPATLRETLAAVAAGTTTPDVGVVALTAAVGWLCLGWLLLGAALSVAGHGPGGLGRWAARTAARVAPAVVRRGVEAALGLSIVVGSVGPGVVAYAEPPIPLESASSVLGDVGPFDRPATLTPLPPVVSVSPSGSSFLVEVAPAVPRRGDRTGVRPARPSAPADPSLLAGRAGTAPAARQVVVQRGDTLWALAAAHLGDDPGPADIDAEWRRWYAANRAVIGADPHLILPGQRLLAPPSTTATRSTR